MSYGLDKLSAQIYTLLHKTLNLNTFIDIPLLEKKTRHRCPNENLYMYNKSKMTYSWLRNPIADEKNDLKYPVDLAWLRKVYLLPDGKRQISEWMINVCQHGLCFIFLFCTPSRAGRNITNTYLIQ